jgi:predicted secreted Zn-dependent protease
LRTIIDMTTWNQSGGDIAELWGETLQELYDEMDAWGLDEVGRCTWQPHLDLAWDDKQLVTTATLSVDIEVLTPAWAKRSEASDPVRTEWDRWSDALSKHEMGHVDLAYQHLDDFETTLIGKDKDDAFAAFERVKKDLQAASDAYDKANDHGKLEGTELDTSIT